MIKDLFTFTTTALIACAALQPNPVAATAAEENAANQFMHQADFDQLAARFEIPRAWNGKSRRRPSPASAPRRQDFVADIGAGTGYFSFPISKQAAKVIAIDIDKRFLDYIEEKRQTQKIGENIETRLTKPDSSGLKPRAKLTWLCDRGYVSSHRRQDQYLKKLKSCPHKDGVLVIIDFKKVKPPPGPPVELRLAEEQVESELKSAGFTMVSEDRDMLPYQYVIKAR